MKPRTKLQHEVVHLSDKRIARITEAQKEWAFRECLEHKGLANKNRVICLDCGDTFSKKLVLRNKATCPHCYTKIKVENSLKRTDKQLSFFAIAEIHGEFQVIRSFELIAHYKMGEKATRYLSEVLQHWVLPNGKREVIGLLHRQSWCVDSWHGNWEIRNKSDNRKFDVYPYKYHPDSQFQEIYRKIGINKKLSGLTFLEAIVEIPRNSKAETLLKQKQYKLLSRCSSRPSEVSRFWPSIKIAIKNKYKIKDVGIWFDYLDLLAYFRKDLHNTKYICPKNLKKEHDRLVIKKQLIIAKRKKEEQRARVNKAQKSFEIKIKRFLGLNFTEGEIEIKVLETVNEFMEEGDILKHCLFVNDYYEKPDSLILSARINSKPIETIEISLSKFKIIQSRGYKNEATPYHDDIIKVVNKNMSKIKSIIKSPKSADNVKKVQRHSA